MSLIQVESFELYNTGSVAEYLASCGMPASGGVSIVSDRSGYAQALAIRNGDVRHTVSSRASVVVFGFAAYHSKRSVAWTLITELSLVLDETPEIGGLAVNMTLTADRWHYYEIVINKASRTVQLWVDNRPVFTGAMPNALQFMTRYTPVFGPGISIDDVVVADETRVGPVSARARFSNVEYPWKGSKAGDELMVTSKEPLPTGRLVAVGVVARSQLADLDNRTVDLVLGDRSKPAVLTTTPTYSTALFTPNAKGADLPFGIRITK